MNSQWTPPRASWRPLPTARCLLACALLLVAHVDRVDAEPALGSLLKPLNLSGYPSPTVAPRFSAGAIDGRLVSMADLRGKVVLLNFWASWCLECRPEMPVLERLYREFAPHGLAVIGINAREGRGAVRRYANGLDLTFEIVLDPDGKINGLYGVVGLPTTFLVGRDGRAVALAVGPREWASPPGRALIHALLAAPVPRPGAP